MSLRKRITLIICSIIIILLVCLSAIIYIKSASILNKDAEAYMISQLERTQENIDLRVKINKLETENLALKEKSISFLKGNINTMDMNRYLINEMEKMNELNNNIYKDLFILNLNGIIASTTMPEAEELDLSTREYFIESREKEITVTSDILVARSDGSLIVITVSPIRNEKNIIIGYAGIAIKAEYFSEIVSKLQLGKTGYYSIVDSNNQILAHRDKSLIGENSVFPITKELLNKSNDNTKTMTIRQIAENRGIKQFQIYKPMEGKKWILIAALPQKEMYEKSIDLLSYVLLIGTLGIVIAIIIGSYVSKKISRPIVAITNYLDRAIKGNNLIEKSIADSIAQFKKNREEFIKESKVNIVEANDEIGNLQKALNNLKGYFISLLNKFESESQELVKHSEELAYILEDNSYRTSNFISTLSHDLKTSITLIKGYVRGLESGLIKDEGTQKKFLHGIERSADDIEKITCDILDSAYEAHNCPKLSREEIKGEEFIEELYYSTKQIILDSKREFKGIFSCGKGYLYIDETKIKRAWQNLINNAIKYSHEGTQIEVYIREKNNKVQFMIKDQGKGIKNEELTRIFDMFYKGENKSSKGYGLGLYITKSIIEAHKSKLYVKSKYREGTTFWFYLNIYPPNK